MTQLTVRDGVARAVGSPSPLLRYAFALAVVLVALAVRAVLEPVLEGSRFLLFFSAVAVAAWYGGTGPGIFATAASLVAWVTLNFGGLQGPDPQIAAILFAVDGLIVSALAGALRASQERDAGARARLQEEARKAERARADLQASRDQLEAILAGVKDGITVQDKTGEMLYANPEAARILGFDSVDELLATPVREVMTRFLVFDEDGAPFPLTNLPGRLALDGQDGPLTLFQYREVRTGQMKWAEALASPVLDKQGNVRFAVNIFREITAQHQADAARDAFLGVLSHELRTPITTIYAGAEVLSRVSQDAPPLVRELSEDIRAESNRLHRLVQDLLVLTRTERDALEITHEPVLVQHVVDDVIRDEQGRWSTAQFEQRNGSPVPVVQGERVYVEQVLRNLIGNAAKFSPPGGTVEVSIERTDGQVEVRVLDHGPGFHEEEGEKLFNLFYRAPSTRGRAPGAGIGLFVSRRLVEAMGGVIWARPREGGGAEFGFSLPIIDPIEDDDA